MTLAHHKFEGLQECIIENYFWTKTYVLGAQKNRTNETVL